ncbi:MAG: OmpA family protein [Ignavibacteria bacterium]|jgi:outer membrane protein OmpA-like peptidoglycan-associated protein|nr:OmpA family protein [Ignavibacteria bacterium]
MKHCPNTLHIAFIAICIYLVAYPQLTTAQNIVLNNNIGLFGGANFNFHSPSFLIPNQNRDKFTNNASSISGFFGIEGNFQMTNITAITGRIAYDFAGIELTKKISNTNNTLDASLHYLEITPMIKFFNIIPDFEEVYFTTGVNFGIPITYHYDFKKANNKPESGDVADATLRVSLPLGIGYIYKYNNELSILPEISYNINFSDVSTNKQWQNWSFSQLKAGISVVYTIPQKVKEEVIASEKNAIDVSIKEVYYLDRNNDGLPLNNIMLEEAEFGEYFPIIPYIFYDVNETELANNYSLIKNPTDAMTGTALEGELIATDAVGISEQLLDIVGKRMSVTPTANLVVTGTIDGKFETDKAISQYRAVGVKNYLEKKYSIDSNRITLKYGNTPSKPSAQTVKDGVVENRRVELSSNSPMLFEPVFAKGDKQRIATPNNAIFVPSVVCNKPITSWELEISQAEKIVRRLSGNNLDEPIRWDIEINELYPSQVPLEYRFTVFTADTMASYIGHIPMDYLSSERKETIDNPDKVISKYSLVLFDFDSPQVTEANMRVIDKFIVPNIKYRSTVDIYGYSDRIGQPEYNKKLSEARANAVKDYILTKNKNVSVTTYGMGDQTDIFDNSTPIGRQLSRTVQVIVVTPK